MRLRGDTVTRREVGRLYHLVEVGLGRPVGRVDPNHHGDPDTAESRLSL